MAKSRTETPKAETLDLHYNLAELPSSQHRAGLAGLVFMVEWLHRQRQKNPGICEITNLSQFGLTLRIDARGLEQLFDEVYDASKEEQQSDKEREGQEALRTEEVTKVVKGKSKTKTVFIYPALIPRGAFLREWDAHADDKGNGPWVKLWREMVWSIPRGIHAQRRPFQARAAKEPYPDGSQTWAQLRKPGASVDLPSTYFLGAQARTAEDVPFRDRARFQFLLQFWPFVAQTYVPQSIDNEGNTKSVGYAIAVPDVADLLQFTQELPEALKRRDGTIRGFRPAGCLIDLSAEAALDFFSCLKNRLRDREGSRSTVDLVLGVDVFHMAKEGNNIRVLGSGRIDPDDGMIDEYGQVRGQFWSPHFRRQWLENLIARRPWHARFDRIFSTLAWGTTIGSKHFRHDARVAFEKRMSMSTTNDDTDTVGAPSLEHIIYKMVGSYLRRKLAAKSGGTTYEAAKAAGKLDEFDKAKEKIARDAFLGIRSRTGRDFVDFFTATICSTPQHIKSDEYALIARALVSPDDVADVRTLTMLALSARS